MNVRDRVTELRRVRAGDLSPHPRNWRTHPSSQRRTLEAILDEVGYADALVARELSDGRLELIDGHLRAETTPDLVVPVLIVDLDDAEAEKVLLTHDPLSSLAETNHDLLSEVIDRVETSSQEVVDLIKSVSSEQGPHDFRATDALPAIDLPDTYQVVIECKDEAQQREVYEAMRKEGRQCRVLTL